MEYMESKMQDLIEGGIQQQAQESAVIAETAHATREVFPPGLYDGIPAPRYHAAAGTSNSDLKLFNQSARIYYNARVLGVKEDDSDLTDDERKTRLNGRLLHLALLEPSVFGSFVSHYAKPEGMSFATTDGKAWKKEHQGLPIISAKEEARIVGARNAVLAHPVAGPLFVGRGQNEVSVFAKHPATGLTLRMRADRLTEDASERPWCVDLKSVPDVDAFVRSARQFRYDVQSEFYTRTLELAGVSNAVFCFVAVELKHVYGEHAVRVVCLDDETKESAREIMERDLERFAECQQSGEWPVSGAEIELVRVKRWNS